MENTMILQVNNLCKNYSQFALQNVSFSLPKGSIMGLIGENGAGKSTTMRLILGLCKPDSGSVSVFGHEGVTAADREQIGVVFDELPFNQTIFTSHLGKVMAGIYQNWDMELYQQYLKRFALPDKKELKEFSRGMKMKLSLAVALSHNAKLLILDEPTSGLDPESGQNVNRMIRRLAQEEGATVFLCTHQLRYAQEICTRFGLIEEVRLLAEGTLEDLRRRVLTGAVLQIHADSVPAGLPLRALGEGRYEKPIRSDVEIPGIVRRIVEGGGDIYGVSVKRPSLEDIYFALTAKGKEDGRR